ncbi:MAG: WG repeat-containing protein [Candidatus Obscuribacterales bacterium]|nr:WG repeat-containing protein [Candidatus Obscuribacterales bacterium]
MCPVKIGGKWGVINKAGEFVIKPVFEGIVGNFSNNRLLVTRGEKYGVIDTAGNFVVEPKYDRIYPFANGMAVLQKGLKFGYINTAGVQVFPPQFDAAQDFGASGRARVFRRVELGKVVELP